MAQICRLCGNPGTVAAEVTDQKTGKISEAICLCDSCLEKVSKSRKVRIVDRFGPEEKSKPAPKEEEPIYMKNVNKLSRFFGIILAVGLLVTPFAVMALAVAFSDGNLLNAFIAGTVTTAGISLIIGGYVFGLITDAVADYLERHQKDR